MTNIIWLSITGAVIISSMLMYFVKFRDELLSHFTIIATVCFLVEVYAPMVWQLRGQTSYRGIQVMAYTPKASLYFIISYIFFCISFFCYSPHSDQWIFRRTNEKDYSDMRISTLWGSYILFFAMYVMYLGLRGRSLLSQLTLGQKGIYSRDILARGDANLWFLMGSLNALITISILLLFYQRKHRTFVYICYVITLILTIASGWRHLMIDMVLSPIIANQILKKKKAKIAIYIFVAIVLYMLVSWIGAARDVYRTGEGTVEAFDAESAFNAFMINIEVFFPYFVYVNYVPKYGYYCYGGTYLGGILQLIPSIVWSGKTVAVAAVKRTGGYAPAIGKVMSEGVADAYWSEAFRNGGIVGMIIMFVLLGAIAAKMRKYIYKKRVSDVVLYALTTTFMFQVLTRSFQNMVQDLIFLLIPFALVRFFTTFDRSKGATVWTRMRD